MNLNVYRFMLELFFMSYTTSFILHFKFCCVCRSFICRFVCENGHRIFHNVLWYFILPLYYRDRYTNSSSFPMYIGSCEWITCNKTTTTTAMSWGKKTEVLPFVDIKIKLKFRTEKYFVRLNGRQGVAVRKKQMNICKWICWKFI